MRSGLNAQEITKLKKELQETLEKAINSFSRALVIDPQNRHTFIHLASAYLMNCNTPMAKGVLQGKYVPEFGTDGAVSTLLAMAAALEGNENEARWVLTQLLETDADTLNSGPLDPDLLIYTATNALTALLRKAGEHAAADEQWQSLALRAKENGQSALFQQSLAELASWQLPKISSQETPDVKVSLGDYISQPNAHTIHNKFVSFDGKWLTWNRENNVRTVMDEDRQVIAVWKENHSMRPLPADGYSGETERRLNTKYGVPDRRITTERGIYMAYDHIGVAFHFIENRVSGWFYY